MPFLTESRSLAQLLAADARLSELEGSNADAALGYARVARLGNEISRGGALVSRSSGRSCEDFGLSKLVKLLPQLDCNQSREAILELERLESSRVDWRDIIENEKAFAQHARIKSVNPVSWVADWWQTRGFIRTSEARHNLTLAHGRLVMLELALRCYRSGKGEPPAQLAQLVPTYLNRIPVDPFSGASFIYKPQGTNWLLYSVGLDKVDDGGKPAGRAVNSKGDVLYDSSW
jgi:hypothetical protein